MTRRPEGAAVRWGVPALIVASCAGAAVVSLNASKPDIPSFAFGSHVVLRNEPRKRPPEQTSTSRRKFGF
jgi:hypothetical protein